jgi:phenylacetate-CoA ligase
MLSNVGSQLRMAMGYLAMRRNSYRPLDQLLAAQWRAARRLMAHAYANVPFYRTLFDEAGIAPQDILSRADWEKVPIIDKTMIREAFPERIIAQGYGEGRYTHDHTSGSSGAPLDFVVDKHAVEMEGLMANRVHQYGDVHYADRFAYLRPLDGNQESQQVRVTLWNRLTRRWRDLPAQSLEISAWLSAKRIVELLADYRPDVLMGYGSILQSVAREVKASGANVSPRVCFSTAEFLSEEHRRFIEQALACKTHRIYGSREFGELGGECTAFSGYHLNIDAFLIEVMRDGKVLPPGAQGEIVVTGLYNLAMPFIRYRIGDVGSLAERPCPCGRTLPLMQDIIGRTADLVTAPSGELVVPEFFWNPWREIPGLLQAQLIQETPHDLHLRLVVSDQFDREVSLGHLEKLYRDRMGDVRITYEFVDRIEREASGKYRMVKSLVPVQLA